MRGSRGGGLGGGRGSDPSPLENHKVIEFLSNTAPGFPGKSQSYQASIQCFGIIGPPAKWRFADGHMMACL